MMIFVVAGRSYVVWFVRVLLLNMLVSLPQACVDSPKSCAVE